MGTGEETERLGMLMTVVRDGGERKDEDGGGDGGGGDGGGD